MFITMTLFTIGVRSDNCNTFSQHILSSLTELEYSVNTSLREVYIIIRYIW